VPGAEETRIGLVFISHTRADHEFIKANLLPEDWFAGIHFIDGGAKALVAKAYKPEIVKNIGRSEWFVVVISEAAAKQSVWVPFEMKCAFRLLGISHMIGVTLDGADAQAFWHEFRNLKVIDCRMGVEKAKLELWRISKDR
jgi:hypothetical protein